MLLNERAEKKRSGSNKPDSKRSRSQEKRNCNDTSTDELHARADGEDGSVRWGSANTTACPRVPVRRDEAFIIT